MHDYIAGIQQIGIGVTNATDAMHHYKELFGFETLIFDDIAEAKLMTAYTGNEITKRRAILTMNLDGGGGFEIWQHMSREPLKREEDISYGDFGINAVKIKCRDVAMAHQNLSKTYQTTDIADDPMGNPHFWVTDKYGNVFDMVGGWHWFKNSKKPTGGVAGAVIGVQDMKQAIKLYKDILGISTIMYDETSYFKDTFSGKKHKARRVLLAKQQSGKGGFGKLLGSIEIELVQVSDRQAEKIYANRYWGDPGFIHICFDVINMDALKKLSEENDISFSVDSQNSFDMESAAGRFCYIETPEGTLIELVETHKVPVLKKLGLYINLKRRNLEKPLPSWMINLLALSKVK